jgi:BNR repeat-like domain
MLLRAGVQTRSTTDSCAGAAGARYRSLVRALAAAVGVLVLAAAAAAATFPGTARPDLIASWGNGSVDTVRCGAGRDVVNADARDRVAADCETVLRVVSADRTSTTGAQHATVAEPDSFAWGETIVAVAQSGRFTGGGAAGTIWATSVDAGRTWRAGLLPGLQRFERVSDPVVAYDPVRGVWLAATLGVSPQESGLMVSRSADGLAWEPPVVVDAVRVTGQVAFDKEWIACDTWPASPRRGRCYLAYTDVPRSGLAVRWSDDGGRTWSPPTATASGQPNEVGAFPVVRPNGDLIVLYAVEQQAIAATRSTDGGVTLGPETMVAALRVHRPAGIRAVSIPSGDVRADGRIVVTWQDCSARGDCQANDVAVGSSTDGVTWAAPARIRVPGSAFAPAAAVDPGRGRVGVVTYAASGCARGCRVDAWLAESADGATFGPPRRLSAVPVPPAWAARATGGAMLGDYLSLSYAAGRAVPLVVLALAPRGTRLRQALFAPVRGG